jgi:3-oxoacyl-[acyl-carrier protein] reductase
MLTGRDEGGVGASDVESVGARRNISLSTCARRTRPLRLSPPFKNFGRLDTLVNNAGTTRRGDFLSRRMPTGGRYALSSSPMCGFPCRTAAAARGRGSLVTIGGASGRIPIAAFTIGSWQHRFAGFCQGARRSRQTDYVQVNTIHPSYVRPSGCGGASRLMSAHRQSQAEVREWPADIIVTRFWHARDIADLIPSWRRGAGAGFSATIDLDGGEVRRQSETNVL